MLVVVREVGSVIDHQAGRWLRVVVRKVGSIGSFLLLFRRNTIADSADHSLESSLGAAWG